MREKGQMLLNQNSITSQLLKIPKIYLKTVFFVITVIALVIVGTEWMFAVFYKLN